MASFPNTPGPDDNYQIAFPQTNATWTSLTLTADGTLFAALGTAAGSFTGLYYDTTTLMTSPADVNGVYWTGNPTAPAAQVTWYVGDPVDATTLMKTPDEQSTNEFPTGAMVQNLTNGNIKLTSQSGLFAPVYAAVTDTTGNLSNIYVGVWNGVPLGWAGWSALPSLPNQVNGENYLQPSGGGQKGGLYNNTIYYDNNNGTLYVGGQTAISIFVPWTTAGQILAYNVAAGTWTDMSVGPNGNGPADSQHAIAIDSNGNLYFAGDGGLFQLNPTTGNWTDFNGNLDISQINSVAVSPSNPNDILAAAQNDGILLTTDDGSSWTDVNNPAARSGGEVAFNPENSSIVYATGITSPDIFDDGILYESTSGGAAGTWNPILTVPFSESGNLPIDQSIMPFALDQVNPSRLLVGGVFPGTVLQQSLDGGATWTNFGANLQFGGTNAPVFTSEVPGNMADVTAIGLAQYQGTFMSDPNFPSTGLTAVTDLGANTYDPGTVYVTDGINIAVTENDGNSWVDRSTNTLLQQPGGD